MAKIIIDKASNLFKNLKPHIYRIIILLKIKSPLSTTTIFIIFISYSSLSISFAEPFYFLPKFALQVKEALKEKEGIINKIKFLNETSEKVSLIDNNNKDTILRDLNAMKKDLISKNLKAYTKEKYLSLEPKEIIKNYKPYYNNAKIKDITLDIHENYIKQLENRLNQYTELNEESGIYKLYIYIIYAHSKISNNKSITTQEKINKMVIFWNSKEYKSNKDYYKSKFDKLAAFEKFNVYSKTDFNRIYNKILNERISPESDYMKGFLYWFTNYKNVLINNQLLLTTDIWHTKQDYSLSCEANSAKDLVNYYNIWKWIGLINEDILLNNLPTYSWSLWKNESNEFVWWDPSIVFVWDLWGKQSSNPNNFTGYWVYADPIIKLIRPLISSKTMEVKKSNFSEKNIIDSLNNNHPVMFWYLSQVKIGKKIWYKTTPTIWKTPEWKIINWYIWEHTWIIVWMDMYPNWKIQNVYFYEWRSESLQKMSYESISAAAWFFNEIIIVKNKEVKNNFITLK